MEKFLVTIEFRYNQIPENEYRSCHKSKMVTVGVFETFDEACIGGNKVLENLESKFKLHKFPSGKKASKERFSKTGFLGSENTLVTNLAYLKTPFEFYCKITTLKYDSIDNVINEILPLIKHYYNDKERF